MTELEAMLKFPIGTRVRVGEGSVWNGTIGTVVGYKRHSNEDYLQLHAPEHTSNTISPIQCYAISCEVIHE